MRAQNHVASPDQTIAAKSRNQRLQEERMASDMREMETVSTEALMRKGWTEASIRRLAPGAMIIARRQSVRKVA